MREFQLLEPEVRAEATIRALIDDGQLWHLQAGSRWAMLSAEGDACTPLFPSVELAKNWALSHFPEAKPNPVSKIALLREWLPQYQPDEVLLMLCPLPNEHEGVLITIADFITLVGEME